MKLIVGLGNPGKIYENSRHNIGYRVVKELSKAYKISLKKDRSTFSLLGKGLIEDKNVILAMPLTFMNISGLAIRQLLKKHRIDLSNLFIICDDMDLEFGRLKLKPQGSSGGNKGLQSIIDSIKTERFVRLRVGIGRPCSNNNIGVVEFVLSTFDKEEKKQLKEVLKKARKCVESWLNKGLDRSMSIFNVRGKK